MRKIKLSLILLLTLFCFVGCYSEEEIEALKAEAYEQGVSDGNSQGYEEGFKDGKTKGDSEGYARGYKAGKEKGENDGYKDGYAEGKKTSSEASYNDGYSKGKTDGYNQGYNKGYSEGKSSASYTNTSSYGSSYDSSYNYSYNAVADTTYTASRTVYITRTGDKYHNYGCQYLRESCIAKDYNQVRYTHSPCKKCKPG